MELSLGECVVNEIQGLRMPRVYRAKLSCGDKSLEFEYHEEIIGGLREGSRASFVLTSDKEKCLSHYFCAQGYVVSNTKIGEQHRLVISLHGFLVVLRTAEPLALNPMDKVYVGMDLLS